MAARRLLTPIPGSYGDGVHRLFSLPVADVWPAYVAKLERKGRTEAELIEVARWLTGFDAATLRGHLDAGTSFADFFDAATLPPRSEEHTSELQSH